MERDYKSRPAGSPDQTVHKIAAARWLVKRLSQGHRRATSHGNKK
jgi:hypothetical protein